MALNIGAVSFGIEANTKDLQKAFSQLAKIRQQVNRLARAQTDGARKAKIALSKQEIATRRAARTFISLRKKMERAGAPAADILRLEQAFQRLTLEMTSGKIAVEKYNRSMETFKDSVSKVSSSFERFKSGAAGKDVGKFATIMRNLESSAVLAIGPLSGVGARIRSIGAIAGRSSKFMIGLFVGVTALSVGFFKLGASALNAGRIFEASMARFQAASGSLSIARKEMGFVIQTALKLGLRIDTSAKAFSRLAAAAAGTSLEGKGARAVFLAVSKAAAALRLSGGEVEGTFRAIEQMMSKGTVQAEELRGQLGERLPGAFRIAAKAMNVTTRELGKLLKLGEITAEEFLPRLAEALEETFGAAAEANINSFTGSMNNLSNQTLLFGKTFDDIAGITRLVVRGIQAVAKVIEFLRKNLVNIVSLIGAVGVGLLVMARVQIAAGIVFIAKAILLAAKATWAWNAAILANPLGGLVTFLAKFGLAIAAAITAWLGFKVLLEDSVESLEEINTQLDKLGGGINEAKSLGQAFDTLSKSIQASAKETKISRQVLRAMALTGVRDVELLTLRFKILAQVTAMNEDQIDALFKLLLSLGSGPIPNTLEALVSNFFRMQAETILAARNVEKLNTAIQTLKSADQIVEDLDLRFAAMQRGFEDLKFFDEVESQVLALSRTLKTAGIVGKAYSDQILKLVATLIRNRDALEAVNDKEKERIRILKEAEQAEKRVERAIGSAIEKIGILRARLKALSEGPESFEIFTKVTEKVMKYRNSLIAAGTAMPVVIALTKEWTRLLEEQLVLTDRWARAGDEMSKAIVGSLEDIILKGGKVSDMLKDIARELFRVALRAVFLDKLQASLGAFFGGGLKNFFFPGVGSTGGGGGASAAHGLAFTVPGSGGSDHVPVQFMAKPGELVTVSRPDQLVGGGRGGGGGGFIIQINAPGADVGTIERIKEVIRVEMVPQIIQASSDTTIARLRRPKFA